MDYILLLCATIASAVKGLVCKKNGAGISDNQRVFELNALIFLGAAMTVALYALCSGAGFQMSVLTCGLSILFACMLMFTQLTQTFAMRYGPASITSLIYSLGFLLPIFYSALFLEEHISVLQILGMVGTVAALYFMIDLKCDRRTSGLWLLLSVLASIGSGTNAIIQKIHRSRTPESEIPAFLVLALFLAAVLAFLISVIMGKKKVQGASRTKETVKAPRMELSVVLFNLLFCGISIGALNVMNLLLAGRLPAIIQFPVFNIGGMILVALGGKLLFHDKLTGRQAVGFVIGCGAILMIGLF